MRSSSFLMYFHQQNVHENEQEATNKAHDILIYSSSHLKMLQQKNLQNCFKVTENYVYTQLWALFYYNLCVFIFLIPLFSLSLALSLSRISSTYVHVYMERNKYNHI